MANISVNEVLINQTPTRNDPVLAISDHDNSVSWALRRVFIEDILQLIEDADIPNTLARVATLTDYVTKVGVETLSNKSFDTSVNFEAGIKLNGVELTVTAAGLNSLSTYLTLLSGLTVTASDLNKLSGLLATVAELNILAGTGVSSSELGILDGLTATTAELNVLDGITSSTNELNILTGVTATNNELNVLDGVTASTEELNVLSGFTGTTEQLNEIVDLLTNNSPEDLSTVSESLSFQTSGTGKITFNKYLPSPVDGEIVKITYVLNDAIAGGDDNELTITPSVSGVDITDGNVSLTDATLAGAATVKAPSDKNIVINGGIIRFKFSMVSNQADFPAVSGRILLQIERTRS